jgi:hypothetical protein
MNLWTLTSKSLAPERDGIDHGTGGLTAFGGAVLRDDREFLDSIAAGDCAPHAAGRSIGVVVEADSIKTVVVLLRPRSGDTRPGTSGRQPWLADVSQLHHALRLHAPSLTVDGFPIYEHTDDDAANWVDPYY